MTRACEHQRVEASTYDELSGTTLIPHLWFRCAECGAELRDFAPWRDFGRLISGKLRLRAPWETEAPDTPPTQSLLPARKTRR